MSGGHGHDEGDAIVLHQERLLPTMLLAASFAVVALFGLSQAGATKFEAKMGKAAYEKVRADMPKVEHAVSMNSPKASYKTENGESHTETGNNQHQETPETEHKH